MNATKPDFTAAASAAGYLYQARLALALCIPYVNSDANISVAIERLDDISFEADGTPIELLQTKHHINRAASLSDASPDLWKTLRAWSLAAANDPSLPLHTRLGLICTSAAADGTAASLLRSSGDDGLGTRRDPKRAQEQLTEIASKSTNAALKSAFEAFLALTPQMRSSLLSAITIIDSYQSIVDLDNTLEDALRLVAPRGKAMAAREMLEGWWWPRICHALMEEPTSLIAIAEIESKIDDIRESLKRNALVTEFEHAEPSDMEVAEYEAFKFVRQLRAIGVGGNRVGYAKRDYYRAFAQRSKWTREHVVLDGELEKFEATLVEEWQPRFSAMCDVQKAAPMDDIVLQSAGQDIYQWVETQARFPFRSLTSRFLCVGSYHILANELRVGWHRDYVTLCSGET